MNVPLLVKSPSNSNEEGELNVPDILMLLNTVEAPERDVVPVNTIVPPPLSNVPLFVQFPATFIEPTGAVSDPVITTLLNEEVLEPEKEVVPPNVTVPEPALRVPLFRISPLILKLLFERKIACLSVDLEGISFVIVYLSVLID